MLEGLMATARSSQQADTIFDVIAHNCIATQARQLSRVITRIYDKALRPIGVKGSQLSVLVAAGKMGIARPPVVCRVLRMDASTLSRNVDRMRARGWLEVVEDEDARAQPFRLTAAGRRIVEKAAPAWEHAQKQAMALLGEHGVRALVAAGTASGSKRPG
jgi:DNA-binding MarR family transcriptional regulator